MSKIVTTKFGRFRGVTDGKKNWWLWECPYCKTWGNLSLDQMEGRVSVYCEAPVQAHYAGEPGEVVMRPCGYHETHEYAKELVTTVQVRAFMGEHPFEEETTQ